MRKNDPRTATRDLHQGIDAGGTPRQRAAQGLHRRHCRVEVRSADGAKKCDQRCQDCDCSPGIGQQRYGRIAAGELFRHDPGSDNRGGEERGSETFGEQPVREGHTESVDRALPIASSRSCSG